MTFLRLTRGHTIALVAGLVLMLVTALDWYTTAEGEESRRIQRIQEEPEGAASGQVAREVEESAAITAETEERNAWDLAGPLDLLVLLGVLAAVAAAIATAALRAADRRYEPPLTPSVIAVVAAMVAALLLSFRLIQRQITESGAEIELGAPLALLALGAIAVGAAIAARAEGPDAEGADGRARAPASG